MWQQEKSFKGKQIISLYWHTVIELNKIKRNKIRVGMLTLSLPSSPICTDVETQ